MIALEAKYHGRCIVALYNSARKAGIMHVKLPIYIRGMTLLLKIIPESMMNFVQESLLSIKHLTSSRAEQCCRQSQVGLLD